jgi:hypothetical protein
MVEYPEVAGYNLVLQNGSGWDVYPVTMVSNDDHGSLGSAIIQYRN